MAAAAAGLGAVAQLAASCSRGAAAEAARSRARRAGGRRACSEPRPHRGGRARAGQDARAPHRAPRPGQPDGAVAQLFLGCLLRAADEAEAQQDALRLLCTLLDGEATKQAVLGGDGAHLPQVLGVIGAAAGEEDTGAELSGAMQRLVLGWQTANPTLLQASASGLSAPVQQNLAKLVSAA